MNRLDRKLHTVLDQSYEKIVLVVVLLLSVLLRQHLFRYGVENSDVTSCLLPWIREYREAGFVAGLSRTIGDYYVPYNLILDLIAQLPGEATTWIAVVSCICEYGTALVLYRLLRDFLFVERQEQTHSLKEEADTGNGTEVQGLHWPAVWTVVAILFLPTCVLNGAFWKQCDAVYTLFLVWSLDQWFRGHSHRSMILFGLSICFKLQGIFLLPLYLMLYLLEPEQEEGHGSQIRMTDGSRPGSFSILHFLWIPVMYLLTGLPAILCGRPAKDVYLVYLNQAESQPSMTKNAVNLYMLTGLTDDEAFAVPAVLLTIVILAAMMVFLKKTLGYLDRRNALDAGLILLLAGWCISTCFMFLPRMHERYDYAALILLFVSGACGWAGRAGDSAIGGDSAAGGDSTAGGLAGKNVGGVLIPALLMEIASTMMYSTFLIGNMWTPTWLIAFAYVCCWGRVTMVLMQQALAVAVGDPGATEEEMELRNAANSDSQDGDELHD